MYTHEPVSTIRIITPKSFLLPQLPKKELFQTFWNFSLCFLCFHNSDVFNTMILIVCQFFSQLLQWERQPAMIYYVIFGNRSLICFLFCVRPAFLNLGPTDILGQIIIFFWQLSCAFQDISFYPLDAGSIPAVVTPTNVFRHCKCSLQGKTAPFHLR